MVFTPLSRPLCNLHYHCGFICTRLCAGGEVPITVDTARLLASNEGNLWVRHRVLDPIKRSDGEPLGLSDFQGNFPGSDYKDLR